MEDGGLPECQDVVCLRDMKNGWAHCAVMLDGVMLGIIIGIVICAFAPMDFELLLVRAVDKPVETHIDRFGPALFDCLVCDAGRGGVVRLHGGGWLWVAHLFKSGPFADRRFAVVE
jgi:hypothetical protein